MKSPVRWAGLFASLMSLLQQCGSVLNMAGDIAHARKMRRRYADERLAEQLRSRGWTCIPPPDDWEPIKTTGTEGAKS